MTSSKMPPLPPNGSSLTAAWFHDNHLARRSGLGLGAMQAPFYLEGEHSLINKCMWSNEERKIEVWDWLGSRCF
jgi:hypothetical protein